MIVRGYGGIRIDSEEDSEEDIDNIDAAAMITQVSLNYWKIWIEKSRRFFGDFRVLGLAESLGVHSPSFAPPSPLQRGYFVVGPNLIDEIVVARCSFLTENYDNDKF